MNRKLLNHVMIFLVLALLLSVGFFMSDAEGCKLLHYCGGKLSVGGQCSLLFSNANKGNLNMVCYRHFGGDNSHSK